MRRSLFVGAVTAIVVVACSSNTVLYKDPPDASAPDANGGDSSVVDTSVGADTAAPCPGNAPLCPTTCCSVGSVCVKDGSGNLTCAQTCSAGGQCPSAKSCCTLLSDGSGACFPLGTFNGQQCLCAPSTPSDCASGCCAPSTDSSGNPIKPYTCKPKDGAGYDCCSSGMTGCGGGTCCVAYPSEYVCNKPCAVNSDCGPSGSCQPLGSGNCLSKLGICVPP